MTDINPSTKEDESEEKMEVEEGAMKGNGSEECEEGDKCAPKRNKKESAALRIIKEYAALGIRKEYVALGPLQCHCINIGSYKVCPQATEPYVSVILDMHRLVFRAPLQSDPSKKVRITLGCADIRKMSVHFGILLVMFIEITQEFSELLRNALHMIENGTLYSDPSTKDDKTHLTLTFLIQCITEKQMRFIRSKFPCKECANEMIEIDQKTALEMLLNSHT